MLLVLRWNMDANGRIVATVVYARSVTRPPRVLTALGRLLRRAARRRDHITREAPTC
jgi:hypothetical protein